MKVKISCILIFSNQLYFYILLKILKWIFFFSASLGSVISKLLKSNIISLSNTVCTHLLLSLLSLIYCYHYHDIWNILWCWYVSVEMASQEIPVRNLLIPYSHGFWSASPPFPHALTYIAVVYLNHFLQNVLSV